MCVQMEKNLLILKRKKAKELHKKGLSVRKIANNLIASTKSVQLWLKKNESEILIDNRGWEKGKPRIYTPESKKKIRAIRRKLEKENSYFIGAKVVLHNYEKQTGKKVSKSFVDRTLKEAKLVKIPRKKRKGLSKYMKYPQYTLDKLGKSMMSIDFIGPKYLKRSNDQINFLSCKYIRPVKKGIVKRIEGQTTNETIRILKEIWSKNPIPSVLKVDNDSALGAITMHKNYVGRLTRWLLNLGVYPLYIAPRCPWNNGHVEGLNSVFSKKFWNRLQFTDEDEIDVKINDFNIAYKKYSNLVSNNPKITNVKHIADFKDINLKNKVVKKFKANKIYFLRIVRRQNEKGSDDEYGFINILQNEIKLPKNLINLFAFCEINLKSKKLIINTELDNGTLKRIKTMPFKIKNIIY